jgi:hypothetical protein
VSQNLKSAEELEEEDRMAQSAKLQELIRRGTPRDLAAAQELMKSLAGANPDAKPDYRSQALSDLNKLEQKVVLLNEMLDNADPQKGEKFVSGDVYDVSDSLPFNFISSSGINSTPSPYLASVFDIDQCKAEAPEMDFGRGV